MLYEKILSSQQVFMSHDPDCMSSEYHDTNILNNVSEHQVRDSEEEEFTEVTEQLEWKINTIYHRLQEEQVCRSALTL